MQILAIADLHGVMDVYEWLAEVARQTLPDVVIVAGDLFGGGPEDEQRQQASGQIIPLLRRLPAPALYLMGNDDWVSLDYEDEQVRFLHGRRLDLGGYGLAGYQYSPPFVGGIHEKPEKEIERDLRALEPLLDERTVLVTHAPAYGFLDRTFGGERVGSRALAALLARRPVLAHIHGHIHESFGREGNHFNVASAGQRRAVAIQLPSLAYEVLG